jgi:very-short-patch-repair endonuclease
MKLYNQTNTKLFRKTLRKNTTPEERKIWNLVRNKNILNFKFFRQYSVGKFILDFYCPETRLCIEIDGGQHNQNLTDIKRTEYLNSLKIEVLRFWNNDINNNLEGVYQVIYKKLKNSPQPSL